MLFYNPNIDKKKYVIATYWIKANNSDLKKNSWELAIGQSVGNPNVRNQWETEEIFEKSSCIILHNKDELENKKEGTVKIGFPVINTNWEEDGISHLMCQLMGGQMDIDSFESCRLIDIEFPEEVLSYFKGPKFGIKGIRSYLNCKDKPLSGAIVKPKTGMSANVLLDMVKELVDGGVDFIKEDEIMSNPSFCSIKDRVPLISKFLNSYKRKIIYSVCINSDPQYVLERAKYIASEGLNSVHINFWSGLGVYNAVRKLDLPLFIHFQKSGDKVITSKKHAFGIDWYVITQLAALMGVDTIHAGMWGGYLNEDEVSLRKIVTNLNKNSVMPALSCGMHPGLVQATISKFGNEFIANVGGAIHGHPDGTKSGALAMRQAIDKNYQIEYEQAIAKWGIVN